MKIESIQTYVLRVPLGNQRFYSSQCAFPERKSLLVRITTDDGLIGWGEGGQYGPAEPVAACINAVLAPQLIGRDPCAPVCIWEELYAATRDFGQKSAYIEAQSAIDIALWDVMGQALGQPIHRLLGGAFRDSVPAYATGFYYTGTDYLNHRADMARLRAEAQAYVATGFDMLKIKVGLLTVEADLERVTAIREIIGPATRLLVDCNHAYNAVTAIHMGRGLEKLGVRWLEEPVPPEDREGYRHAPRGARHSHRGRRVRIHALRLSGFPDGRLRGYRPARPLCGRRVLRAAQDPGASFQPGRLADPARLGLGNRADGRPALPGHSATLPPHGEPHRTAERAGGRVRPQSQSPARPVTDGTYLPWGRPDTGAPRSRAGHPPR